MNFLPSNVNVVPAVSLCPTRTYAPRAYVARCRYFACRLLSILSYIPEPVERSWRGFNCGGDNIVSIVLRVY